MGWVIDSLTVDMATITVTSAPSLSHERVEFDIPCIAVMGLLHLCGEFFYRFDCKITQHRAIAWPANRWQANADD
jgi:hypothetical protein